MSVTVVALGDEGNRAWGRFRLITNKERGVKIGDVVRTKRGMQCIVESWDNAKVHVVCWEGKYHSFYPASLRLKILEECKK
jgi:hypothetical protein